MGDETTTWSSSVWYDPMRDDLLSPSFDERLAASTPSDVLTTPSRPDPSPFAQAVAIKKSSEHTESQTP